MELLQRLPLQGVMRRLQHQRERLLLLRSALELVQCAAALEGEASTRLP